MSDYVRKIVYLSDEDKNTLFSAGTVTVDGVTITYDDDDVYITPTSETDIAALVDGVFVTTVSGTDPVIVAEANHRYVAGTVSTISITPPASGSCEVIFTSGSPAAVLTLPQTVKMPDWWDGVEADYTYDIIITDGVYGGVMQWALA